MKNASRFICNCGTLNEIHDAILVSENPIKCVNDNCKKSFLENNGTYYICTEIEIDSDNSDDKYSSVGSGERITLADMEKTNQTDIGIWGSAKEM